jgi:uncharacterized FlaG/YvyC family protein
MSKTKKEGTAREEEQWTEKNHKKAYKEYLERICDEIMKFQKRR